MIARERFARLATTLTLRPPAVSPLLARRLGRALASFALPSRRRAQ
ncbi:MAG: hypothetical protein ICV64_07230 [Thermoleophilia bacterium]|nr:hypothetical protein [Thermoleophilia bacterium]